MLNNIKLIGIVFLAFLLLTNCNKENKQDETAQTGEIVFSSIEVDMEKSIECNPDLVVTHARINLNNGNIAIPQGTINVRPNFSFRRNVKNRIDNRYEPPNNPAEIKRSKNHRILRVRMFLSQQIAGFCNS